MHPPQGAKLLAWCKDREDLRQFFVRATHAPTRQPGDFREDRMVLLEGLFDKESGWGCRFRCLWGRETGHHQPRGLTTRDGASGSRTCAQNPPTPIMIGMQFLGMRPV